MLQWMGGSRKKITAARKGVKHRQQRFFERRKQQQSAEITENGEEDNVKPRLKLEMQRQVQSLDILSLTRLCQAVPSAVEINAPVEKSSAKNQCCVSKGGHGMEHLEQIHGAARGDAYMNEAHKENCKLKTDSIIHGPEFESGRTKCLSPTKKDAATQWTPASALAAAECLLQKPKEVPQSTQVVKARAIHGHLPSKSAVTILKILSDDESGGLSNKKSPSEFYAAFPLKGIGLLNTHTPEDLVMQGGFDRRSQRKMQLKGESTEAHAKRIHNSPEAFLKGQRAWQSPMNESIDFQRSTGLDLDNMVLCKPCPDKNYCARLAKDLICDEESASTQPFKDTPKKIANRLSSLVTDKHKKWKTSTFEECMVLKFDVPSPSQKKREPKVNLIEAQQCRTDGTFTLGHIYCREDRCEAVAGK
ncbi:hypothetical protein O6H91_01G116100 [Diphasiastrum complanatum]|uniref:Uncharacterized protein n=1 Tax=Diphasiastrum complanatum TaxID=34168 RepID=A0ACC2EUZ7_DIPCM|nr:hypothetical protein O6H91_01G116100 [Diphasiastrum complanatum]